MALAAGGELDDALGVEVAHAEAALLVPERRVVDAGAAAADQAARIAQARSEAGLVEELDRRDARGKCRARDLDDRQLAADPAFLEDAARRLRRRFGRLRPMAERRRRVGEDA